MFHGGYRWLFSLAIRRVSAWAVQSKTLPIIVEILRTDPKKICRNLFKTQWLLIDATGRPISLDAYRLPTDILNDQKSTYQPK